MEYNEVKHEKIVSLQPNSDWLVMQRILRQNELETVKTTAVGNMSMSVFVDEIAKVLATKTDTELSHVLRVIVSETARRKTRLQAKK